MGGMELQVRLLGAPRAGAKPAAPARGRGVPHPAGGLGLVQGERWVGLSSWNHTRQPSDYRGLLVNGSWSSEQWVAATLVIQMV